MTCNICLCGSQAGYPHHPACPRPLFRYSEKMAVAWQEEFASNKEKLIGQGSCFLCYQEYDLEDIDPDGTDHPGVCPGCGRPVRGNDKQT